MRRSRRESGEGQLGCLFGVALLLLAVFVAWKVIPVKVRAADLRQAVVDEAKSAGTHNDEQIMKYILAKAADQDLPVTEDNVKISRRQNDITIDVNYVMPIEFPGYTYNWHINHHAENPIF
ncbi:MAG: hypothetical protein ACXVIJ_02775 [Thermoanaerobaculia bacterium]